LSVACERGIAVSRFYFDVREGGTLTQDQEGLDLADLDAAEREAVQAAAEIGNDILPKRHAPEIRVEVRDEHGQYVLSVAVTMSVEWRGISHARRSSEGVKRTRPGLLRLNLP
jgi:hypothetical protein